MNVASNECSLKLTWSEMNGLNSNGTFKRGFPFANALPFV